jgi:hypothetical protein
MPTTQERLGIVETKVQNLTEKVDDLKTDVRDVHDCLDRTRDSLESKLDHMLVEYRDNREKYYARLDVMESEAKAAHGVLERKISNLEKVKTKYTLYGIAALAFVAGAGWMTNDNLHKLFKFLIG